MLAFSALADPTRLRIIEMLASHGQLSATHISQQFTVSPPAISQHLKILREAGLVQVETRAQQRIYSIDPSGMTQMEQWMHHMRELWSQRFDRLDALLKEEMAKQKPQRSSKHVRKKT